MQMRIAQDRAKQTRRITLAFRRLFRLSEVSHCSHASWHSSGGCREAQSAVMVAHEICTAVATLWTSSAGLADIWLG